MALIVRSLLARGTKLLRDHVFAPLSSAATALGAQIVPSQMETPDGVFRLTFHIPVLGGSLVDDLGIAGRRGNLLIPFVLPPPQDSFSTTVQIVDGTTPTYLLDELCISFDQRGEPAAILDVDSVNEGDLNYDEVGRLRMNVRIMEKPLRVFDAAAPFRPDKEVFGVELPETLWSGRDLRENPFLLSGIARSLHPYRSYCLVIEAEDLNPAGGADNYAFVSLVVSLKFKTPLLTRDVSSSDVQNMPTKHGGVKAPAVVTIQPPAYNSTILADGATGVQTNVGVVDLEFLRKLRGGYDQWSDVPPTEHIARDACYEVLAVPMFGFGVAIRTTNIDRLPYVGGAPYTVRTCDRRVIPIRYPLVIHHVVAVVNWAAVAVAAVSTKPTPATFVTDIGVGIGVGLRADNYTYQQVARVTYDPTTVGNFVIDRIKNPFRTTLSNGDYDYELVRVPLVCQNLGPYGTSYPTPTVETGPPFFVGQAHQGTLARTAAANGFLGTLVVPETGGQEQFLEVRWRFGDTAVGMGDAGTYPAGTIFTGYGGNFVLIFCKKHLA